MTALETITEPSASSQVMYLYKHKVKVRGTNQEKERGLMLPRTYKQHIVKESLLPPLRRKRNLSGEIEAEERALGDTRQTGEWVSHGPDTGLLEGSHSERRRCLLPRPIRPE